MKPLGRGTRIELVLKEDMAEFLEERKVNKQQNWCLLLALAINSLLRYLLKYLPCILTKLRIIDVRYCY